MNNIAFNPAELAAEKALTRMYACIDECRSFLLEAGAGAGKTYSLIQALRYLIKKQGPNLSRRNQKLACITFTNVAVEEIKSRTDSHPTIHPSTIHAFCWSIIKDFQPYLRNELPKLNRWPERLEEVGGIGTRDVDYDLGYWKIEDEKILLHHDDVLALTVKLIENSKFRILLSTRYPILLIDEYQDTDKGFAEALITHFIDNEEGPLIGFFGDHWQKIYGSGCGKIENPGLHVIGKEANFRSVPVIVECLNRMRPELPQYVMDPDAEGTVAVYHTNDWQGTRLTGQHWGGDLPAEIAHDYLETLKEDLTAEGWDFSPDQTKILMLTHRVLVRNRVTIILPECFPTLKCLLRKKTLIWLFLSIR